MAKYLKKPKMNIAMNIAMVLFCLTVFTTYLASGLYAKYSTQATGSDSARVIKFGEITITETGDFLMDKNGNSTGKMLVIPGVDIMKQAAVNYGGSEAATYVFLEVVVSDHWSYNNRVFSAASGKIQWTIQDSWTKLNTDGFVFYKTLEPNQIMAAQSSIGPDETANGVPGDVFVVTTDAEDANRDGKTAYSVKVSSEITRNQLETLTGVSVSFRASVVQANGFDSVVAAWQSLSAKEGAA